MTLFPVIERELRAESRSAFTYWLRVAGATALLGAGFIYFVDAKGLGTNKGAELFRIMHVTLFVAIWIVALLMTADSISRERREGTLGLLFLTPLKPFEVVLAKGLAHGLRATAVVMAAVPVLVVPFLMGGVGWADAVAAVLIDFSVLCCALAAGLFASAFNRTMTRSLVWSVIGGLFAFAVLLSVLGVGIVYAFRSRIPQRQLGLEFCMQVGFFSIFQPSECVSSMSRGPAPITIGEWLGALAGFALASIVFFGLVVMLAAQGVKRMARDRVKSAARERVEKQLFTPKVGLGFYRRWMQRLLNQNPVGWLERRTWQARLVTWAWLAVVMSLMSSMLASQAFNSSSFTALNMFLAWVLVGNVALTAAGSLRRERESGVIELLLVSPLPIPQIVGGRVRSIVWQFLPAATLIFGSWLWLSQAFQRAYFSGGRVVWDLQLIACFLVTLLALPVVGLYFSLRCRMFVVALFWTAVTALAVPWLAGIGVAGLADRPIESPVRSWQVGLGIVAAVGALALLRWRGAGSPGISMALAGGLAVLGALSLANGFRVDSWGLESALMVGLLSASAVQIGIAAWLGALLRRRLEARQFALPQ